MSEAEKAMVVIQKHIPGATIKYKNEAKGIEKLIFLIASIFNKRMMTNYVTVLGKGIWFPSKEDFESDPGRAFIVLSHEYVHLLDGKKWGILFNASYLFPQVLFPLSIFAVLSFLNPIFLVFLVFIASLLPLPAKFREIWEMRANTMSMFMRIYKYGSIDDTLVVSIHKKMTGWDYYKTNWSKERSMEIINRNKLYVETRDEKYKSIYALDYKYMDKWKEEIESIK